jgi:chemotaxis signal transduction protein
MPIDAIRLRLAELRRSFDASFAAPARSHDEERRSALAIRAGEGRFAVRVEDLAGVEACRQIVKLPGSLPGLLGVAGIRGRLLAAYDLGALLGQPSRGLGPSRAPVGWLLVCGAEPGIGLLIDEIEAFVRVAAADFKPMDTKPAGGHLLGVLQRGESSVGVVDIASIAAAVARRAEESREGRRRP